VTGSSLSGISLGSAGYCEAEVALCANEAIENNNPKVKMIKAKTREFFMEESPVERRRPF
jgi:hypothetical protein